ncbi:MAG: lipid-A-disaccharide synthase [Xenococcaceae cyanobacterium MO_188.B32]|nr:lipid-A-disaccharide synthase [Xenococcaceae cyanobacterium MO_188.B32]
MQPIDIVILSNGPGEVATWVRPVVKALRAELRDDRASLRISVVLSHCPHATGKEADIVASYPEVDRVQSAQHFFPFLLWGKTADNWDWRKQGIVIFLGGDQFYTLAIGKRLGYRTLVYAEWDARWYRWIDRFAIMKAEVMTKIPPQYHHKFTVVGDLIADIVQEINTKPTICKGGSRTAPTANTLIGLLPGSKPAKLAQGVPLCLAIAEKIHARQPEVNFIIPVAPTLELETLANYANPQFNPVIDLIGGVSGKLILAGDRSPSSFLLTSGGTKIKLITQFPAYQFLVQCQLCLTTVGANTAELGSLGIPMIVLLPTQQLDAMRAWNGIPGMLSNLPGVGTLFASTINWLILRQKRLFAWPNIWAKKQIVPEVVGQITADTIAAMVLDLLASPERLIAMHNLLLQVRGRSGASQKLACIIRQKLLTNLDEI